MSGFAYDAVAIAIFAFVAINFLFPCNVLIPLDRRTTSVLGAVLCYLTRRFVFPNHHMDVLNSVDFDVMILLASIMVINHLVVHLKETKDVIDYLQQLVQSDPSRGLWVISFAAFIASPFLTNDGVCLLFVEPILNAFEYAPFAAELAEEPETDIDKKKLVLRKEDAIYFLLALACSANIGSALTYTGNPQNMIVASDSIEVLPSYKFLVYMFPATLFSWLITMEYIRRCWMQSRLLPPPPIVRSRSPSINAMHKRRLSGAHSRQGSFTHVRRISGTSHSRQSSAGANASPAQPAGHVRNESPFRIEAPLDESAPPSAPAFSPPKTPQRPSFWNLSIFGGEGLAPSYPSQSSLSPLSPRRRKAQQRAKLVKRVTRIVTSPFPYVVLILLGLMVVMIFIDVMPISGLICVFAILMVVVVVMGNHWRNKQIWVEEEEEFEYGNTASHGYAAAPHQAAGGNNKAEVSCSAVEGGVPHEEDLGPLTREDKLDNLNHFFEALFNSIDYSLLIIFLGLFIVVENVDSTGLPAQIWGKIVGKSPFSTAASITGISAFVLITSQFLGNVAVIQLAKPNVESLDDETKRLAWAIISFVATVGGNLTITGSAANIIVAEKAARLDATMAIDFFKHFHVCFWVTLVSCAVGACMITAIGNIDNAAGSNW